MELAIIAVLILGVAVYTLSQKKKDERVKVASPEPIDVVNPTIQDLPTGAWCYIDEGIPHLDKPIKSESNGAQDLLASIALMISRRGTKPAFIGVSCNPHGVDKSAVVEIMQATALNIPVYEGSAEYHATDSELAQAITRETKKGKFDISLGSPAGDLEFAFKNGAHVHNVTLYALLRNTWNATGDGGMAHYQREAMKRSADYVASRLSGRIHEIESPDYYHLLYKKNLPPIFRDTGAFIELNRDLEAWDIANSNHVLARNRELNTAQGLTTGSLRIAADALATAAMCGIHWRDAGAIMSGIQHGLDIMKGRIAQGAVNTITYTTPPKQVEETFSPINRATFTESSVKSADGSRNPFKYRRTATITHAKLNESKYEIKHSMDGKWLGKEYQPNRYIDGTDGLVYFDRDKNSWMVFMFEYSLIGEVRRPKGWRDVRAIKKGDPVGLISSTNTRGGDWNIAGQENQRSNIHWTTAK